MRAPLLILGAGKKRGAGGGGGGPGTPSGNLQSLPFVETFMFADGAALLASGYADGVQTNAAAPIVDSNTLIASSASTFLGVDLAAPILGAWFLIDMRFKRDAQRGPLGCNAYTAGGSNGGYVDVQADIDGVLHISSGCDFNGDFFDGAVDAQAADLLTESGACQLAVFIGADTDAAAIAVFGRPTSGDAWAMCSNAALPGASPSFQPQSLQYGLFSDNSADANADRSALTRVEIRAGVLADDPYATGLPT